jgi:hypothetical protein
MTFFGAAMHHENKPHKTEPSAAREAGASLAELGFEVASEFLPDGLIGILVYLSILVLMFLIWAGRSLLKDL